MNGGQKGFICSIRQRRMISVHFLCAGLCKTVRIHLNQQIPQGEVLLMKDMVKEIVDMDRKAREIMDEAQQEKLDSEKEISQMREKIREDYLAKARERIKLNEPQEREAAEKAWKAVEARQNEISAKLDAQYKENGKRWAEELARRVLNA